MNVSRVDNLLAEMRAAMAVAQGGVAPKVAVAACAHGLDNPLQIVVLFWRQLDLWRAAPIGAGETKDLGAVGASVEAKALHVSRQAEP